MANTIKLKRASGSDPGNSDLAVGELAIRTSNCKLFSKNDGGSAVGVVAGSADTLTTARNIAGVSFDGSANISLNNNAITNGAGYITDLVSDTSPQLGGDLDMNSQSISSGILNIKNTGSQSEVRLYCEVSNAHYISLKAPAHSTYSGNLTYTLPPTVTNGYFLQTNGSGVLSWAAVNTDLVNDTSPQLGGSLDVNDFNILNGTAILDITENTRFEFNIGGTEYLDINAGGIDVTGNITVTGTVDGVDIASLNSTVSGKLSNVVEDTSPQLGGDLQSNGNNIDFADNDKAFFGSSNDMLIEHDGSHSYIDNNTGDLIIRCDGDDVKILAEDDVVIRDNDDSTNMLKCINGGAVEAYHNGVKALSTTTTGVGVFGNSGNGILDIIPTGSATYSILNFHNVGQSSNAQIITASGQSIYVGSGGSGDVVLRTGNSDNKVRCIHSGAVELYHDTSKKAETVSGGFSVTGTLSTTGNISVPDDIKVLLGASDDIEIYHTSGHSYIQNNTGGLRIEADTLRLRSLTGTENYITADVDGSVALYHNGSLMAETAADGLEVTGSLTTQNIDCTHATLYIQNGGGSKTAAAFNPAAGQFFYHNHTLKLNTSSSGITVAGTCTATAFSGDGSALTNLPSSGLPLSGGELTGDLTTHVVKPDGNGTRSLGTSSLRWSDVFTSDLHLSNEGSSNKVDNSWGDFTIQEGIEDLFLINNRNGKMYKFLLKEVG